MQAKCHKDKLQEAPNVLVHVIGNKPGARIGVVKFYESGYYSTSADHTDWTKEQVNAFVNEQNKLSGIPESVADAAMAGSMFGWHVPTAKPACDWYGQWAQKRG